MLVVTSATLKEQAAVEQARATTGRVLRLLPVAGTRLDGLATRLTYDASLVQGTDDKLLWQGRIEVRSGILERQLERRQRRAAHKLVALMRRDGVLPP